MSHDPPSTVSILTDSFEPPERIGPYRLLDRKPIGAGGMGEVYLAEQDTPRRRVALKIIKLGMDSREVIRRFEQEREALGLMEHPNVARIYDAGATPEGRPYFVMEYVRGVPITKHCDEQRLTIRQRIELFIAVCDGIQHAHQKAIIHRDVTPRNVLVEFADGQATPKVIDFGLAKALGARLTDGTLSADLGGFKGTLPYSSPEQAGGNRDIDTRTDIYSLGALLYELLCGVPPIDFAPESPLDERLRRIREHEPLPPSLRIRGGNKGTTEPGNKRAARKWEGEAPAEPRSVARPPSAVAVNGEGEAPADPAAALPTFPRSHLPTPGAAPSHLPTPSSSHLSALAHLRRTDHRSLIRELRNEPDWIVMKCLEKERARRYESVSALVADIRRYLAGEPVLARAPSVVYRLRKFVVRHRVPVTAAAVFVVTLSSLTGWAMRERERAEREARAARLAEARESGERQRAETALAAETAARTRESEALANETRQRQKAEAINQFVSKALVSSDPNQAGKQDFTVKEAMDQAIRQLDVGELKDQPETEAALRLTISQILDGNARSREALRLAERALEINQELHPGDHSDVAESLNGVGYCLQSLGRPAEAMPKYEAALEMRQRLFEGDHPDIANSLNNVGSCLGSLGRFSEALRRYDLALEMRHRMFKGDHPSVATSLNNVAYCLGSLGRFNEALPKYEAALEMEQRLFGADHPSVARSFNNVGYYLQSIGRSNEALRKFEASLEMQQRLFNGDHPDVAMSLNNVAYCLQSLKRSSEALSKYEAALEMRQRLIEGDHPDLAISMTNVAGCLQSLGRSSEALPKFEAALEMQQRLFNGDHPDVAMSLNNVAGCLESLGRFSEALPKFEAALEVSQRLFQGDHPNVALGLNNIAGCLRSLDRSAEALPKYEAALQMYRRILPPDHPQTPYPQIGLAKVLTTLNRYSEAEPLLLDVAEQCRRSANIRRMYWPSVLRTLVSLYDAWHTAEPVRGYDVKAAEWRAKLEEWRASTQPTTTQAADTQAAPALRTP